MRFTVRNLNYTGAFNGSDNIISLGVAPSLQLTTFTLAGWFNFRSLGGTQYLIRASGSNYYFFYNNGTIVFGFFDGTTYYDSYTTFPFPVATWNHLAFTYDQVTRTLYFNGEEAASDAQTQVPDTGGDQTYALGAYSANTNPFSGWAADIRIYKSALAADDVSSLCHRGTSSVDTSDLVLSLPLDESSGTVAHDASGNGNTGSWGGTTDAIHTSQVLPPFWPSRTIAS